MHLIAALYKFAHLEDFAELRAPLIRNAERHGVRGMLLLAREGINGTLAGEEAGLRAFLDQLRADPRLADLTWKESWSTEPPFRKLRIRLKREIVSMGAADIVSTATVGDYVKPEDWNALISDPEVAVIDVRNDYETGIGGFEGAIDPQTRRFRDFPAWAAHAQTRSKDKPVAMYCTGGIRCEKASAYMRSIGFERVYHLEGGILAYLEQVPQARSLWRGGCFVFDERVSVGHGLTPLAHDLCRGCRRPITAEDRAHPDFIDGVQCGACAAQTSEAQRRARRERLRQIALAERRGERHLGRRPASFDADAAAEPAAARAVRPRRDTS